MITSFKLVCLRAKFYHCFYYNVTLCFIVLLFAQCPMCGKSTKINRNITSNKLLRLLIHPKIVNGEPAALGEIPYQVGFKAPFPGGDTYLTFCGGSILKPKVVLSAAHCFVPTKSSLVRECTGRLDRTHYRVSYATAGILEMVLPYPNETSVGQWRRLNNIHFPFTFHFPEDDIAVVTLTEPFFFNEIVNSIPYATMHKDYTGLSCLASGYGKTHKTKTSNELRKAVLEIMSPFICNKLFGRRMRKFICSSSRLTDVLQGDSGGPLVCTGTKDPAEGRTGVLVGIVSGGVPGRGSLFTRISAFKKYIALAKTTALKTTPALVVLTALGNVM